MTALAVRGRLDLVHDLPLGRTLAAFVRPDDPYRALFPARFDDPAAWRAAAQARRGHALSAPLAAELLRLHDRLGAGEASRANAQALAEGRALCVVAGQQPGPLGGPLYSWHKTHAAVALAAALARELEVPVVPVFWNATEDDDFDEIAGAQWAGPDLAPHRLALPREARAEGRLVGSLPAGLAAPLWRAARGAWSALPGSARAARLLDSAALAAERDGDLGDVVSALFLAAFAGAGLVVVDPRLPAFRAAARPLYARYLERRTLVRDLVDAAGERAEALGATRGFAPAQTEFALFAVDGDRRRRLAAAEGPAAVADPAIALAPGAMLRPVVQDFVLPSIGLVAGPGEVAYLAQLPAAYEALEAPASIVAPRWTATWLPAEALAAADAAGVPVEALVADPDRALAEFYAAGVPPELARELAALKGHVRATLDGLGERARALDASLPEFVRATAARVDWRLGRLEQGLVRRARRRWKRAHPAHAHLASYLRPYGRLQERTLAWLDPIARGGTDVEAGAGERAAAHVADLLAGRPLAHDVLALGEGA
jgi:bacillithiol biosynthesis cysteine-adding enzyme BshC